MNAATRPAWSAGQRDRLAAMGLDLYVRAGARRPAAPTSRRDGASVQDAPASGTRVDARSADDRLVRALLRAAGVAPGDAADDVRATLPPLDGLRGNPAAKRALWPRLRALRRARRG
jgi:hypothetical protein